MRLDSIKTIDNACPNHQDCSRTLESSQDKARTFGSLAVALGAGGGALLVTGIVLVATSGLELINHDRHGSNSVGRLEWRRSPRGNAW